MPRSPITTPVPVCPRCRRQDHPPLIFLPLTHPAEDEDGTSWSHWASCPTNGEPIMLRAVGERARPTAGAA